MRVTVIRGDDVIKWPLVNFSAFFVGGKSEDSQNAKVLVEKYKIAFKNKLNLKFELWNFIILLESYQYQKN